MKMKTKTILVTMLLAVIPFTAGAETSTEKSEKAILPDGTYMFAQRDTCDLFLDVYDPAEGSETSVGGKEKPAIIFVFGGGFITGSRDDTYYTGWYKTLTDNGYRVIAIDYRLGLKGATKVGIAQVNAIDKAIHLAVEDLFSATAYILENAETLGVDPANIVISGSSAGAITVLQADYELSNRTEYASVLPEGFEYAGVMSFSGGILSRHGKLKYGKEPAPTMLLHGTEDKVVNYKQITLFNIGFFGSDRIASRFEKFGYVYNILRYEGNGHEIASLMGSTTDEQFEFIETSVMQGKRRIVDMTVYDPEIKGRGVSKSRKELYGGGSGN